MPASNVRASSVSPSNVTIGWTDSSNNETGFVVHRAVAGVGTLICSVSQNTTTCNDGTPSIQPFTSYHVYSWNGAGATAQGGPLVAALPIVPLASPDLQWISRNDTHFSVESASVAGADEFILYRYQGGWTEVQRIPATSLTFNEPLPAAGTNVYIVAATRGSEIQFAEAAFWVSV